MYNNYYDNTVPVSIKNIFSCYKYRCLIKFIYLKGIEKDLTMYHFLKNILTPYHQVVTLVVEIVLPEKKICQKKKLEVRTICNTMVELDKKEEKPTPAYEKANAAVLKRRRVIV